MISVWEKVKYAQEISMHFNQQIHNIFLRRKRKQVSETIADVAHRRGCPK